MAALVSRPGVRMQPDCCDTAVSALDLSHRLLRQLQMAKVSRDYVVSLRFCGRTRSRPKLSYRAGVYTTHWPSLVIFVQILLGRGTGL